jgi:hypothetical protein
MVAAVSTAAAVTAAIAPTVAATVSTALCLCGHVDAGNRCRACYKSQRKHGQGR